MVTGAAVVQADVYTLDVVAGQELPIVGVGRGDAELLRYPRHLILADVRRGHDLGFWDLGVLPQMVLADLPNPDNADAYLVAHGKAPSALQWGEIN